MNNTSLVQFGQGASTVEISNDKTGCKGARLLSAAEFKRTLDKALSAREKANKFNAYLRESGKANTAALAGALTSGELLVVGFKGWEKSGKSQVTFLDASKVVDKAAKAEAGTVSSLEQEIARLKKENAELKAAKQ